MELSKAITLIKPGISPTHPSTWADLGAGSGLFTRALASLLPKGSTIYAVDSNKSALDKIKPIEGIQLIKIIADFDPTPSGVEGATVKIERSRNLPFMTEALDGILMANSLHFVKDKTAFIKKASAWLKKNGCFIIVEYNMDKPNRWVPYPISYETAQKLFSSLGYQVELIGEERSVYNKEGIYAIRGVIDFSGKIKREPQE